MAITLEAIRNQILTSLYGRRLGLDSNEFLVGARSMRQQVTELTSASTNQTVTYNGVTIVNATSAVTSATNTFNLPSPIPGASFTICSGVNGTTSTQGSTTIAFTMPASVTMQSSDSPGARTVMLPFGTAATLTGVSTALYQMTSHVGLAAASTST